MTLAAPYQHQFTVEEYLRIERGASVKHEYREGELVAMAGGSVSHSLITLNCGGELRLRLKGKPCQAFDSNLRVRVSRGSLYCYPDVTVICGKPEIDPDDKSGQTVTNPRLIVEVLSPLTESYDRRTKFDHYRQLESFREYVVVSQDMPRVETYSRNDDGTWTFASASRTDGTIRLASIDVDLPLSELFAGVEFPPLPLDLDAAGPAQ